MNTSQGKSQDKNEGEGSRTAAHHYEAGVKKTIASGKVDKLADEAKQALDGPEGESLRRAEQAGKKPPV
mgnify:FL=1